ncbi:aspartic proteinase CDR1-like [Rosa rugosa]|uniref:aspartic proteinase CDR1-like n=1 Tax=Rosa rugosa TaxID=74645 RepID=UPI002B412B70|nr:aspartic proteinase CDR1-like [Rosa rugosa]
MSFLSNNSNATPSSKMYFGRPNTSSGPEVVTTPLLSNGVSATQTFYIVELQGISVGANNITLNADAKAFKGNMIIDSGTTLTYLPELLYDSFKSAIEEELKDRDLEVKQDPTGSGLSCFLTKYDILPGPNVTFHFKGADVKLKSANTFVRMDDETVCLAFSRGSGVGTYGNWAQINYLVSDEGDVLYVFPRDYRAKLVGRSFIMRVEPLLEKEKAGAEYLARVSFGTTLIASIILVFAAILVALIAIALK